MNIPHEVSAAGSGAVAVFEQVMQKYGDAGYRFALMCALKAPPGANTEREFFHGDNHGAYLEQMGPWRRARVLAMAKAQGVNPNSAVYKTGLGFIDSKADIVKLARLRKKAVESDDPALNYEPEQTPRKQVAIAQHILDRMVGEQLKKDKGLAEKVKKKPSVRKDIENSLIEKHAPHGKKKLVKG